MKKICFFCENHIPYLKEYFSDWGEWIEFQNFHQLAIEIKKEKIKIDFIKNLDQAIVFIKTSTHFNSSLVNNDLNLLKYLNPLLKKIKVIGTAAVGEDHIDFDYLDKRNISFYNTPGCNRFAVTDYVFFLILKYCTTTKQNLSSLTVGVVGVGHIGFEVATVLLNLHIKVLLYDPWINPNDPKGNFYKLLKINSHLLHICSSFKELLVCSGLNILTLHVPLIYSGVYPTFHMVNDLTLKYLTKNSNSNFKKTFIINSCRGGVVDENAILPYLNNSLIDYAADVWESEPNLNLGIAKKSFFISPHIAGYTYSGKFQAAKMLFQQISAYLIKSGIVTQKQIKKTIKKKKSKPHITIKGNLSSNVEKELYQIFNRITGLEKFNAKFKKSLKNPSEQQRVNDFVYLRKKSLRNEIRDFDFIFLEKAIPRLKPSSTLLIKKILKNFTA